MVQLVAQERLLPGDDQELLGVLVKQVGGTHIGDVLIGHTADGRYCVFMVSDEGGVLETFRLASA